MVELLFYVALFALLSISVISSLFTMIKAFKETSLTTELSQSSGIMERMTREIRQASNISSITATDIKIDTTDDTGANRTVEFLLSGNNLELLENGALTGNLNSPNIAINALAFTKITTALGTAVKIQLTVRAIKDPQNRPVDWNDTAVLRGEY